MTERFLCFFPQFCTWKQVGSDGRDVCRVGSGGNQCPYCKGEIELAMSQSASAWQELTIAEEALRKAKERYEEARAYEDKVKAEALGEGDS